MEWIKFVEEWASAGNYALADGIDNEKIEEIETFRNVQLPEEYRALLRRTIGFEIPDFGDIRLSAEIPFDMVDLFPSGFPVAQSSHFFWVLDWQPQLGLGSPVYLMHSDPPCLMFVCKGLEELFKMFQEIIDWSEFLENERGRLAMLWKLGADNPSLMTTEELEASNLSEWRTALPVKEALVFSSSKMRPGDGFPWGLSGPKTQFFRHPESQYWAVEFGKKKAVLSQRKGCFPF